LATKPKHSTDLIFRSQQIGGDKNHVSVELWPAGH